MAALRRPAVTAALKARAGLGIRVSESQTRETEPVPTSGAPAVRVRTFWVPAELQPQVPGAVLLVVFARQRLAAAEEQRRAEDPCRQPT